MSISLVKLNHSVEINFTGGYSWSIKYRQILQGRIYKYGIISHAVKGNAEVLGCQNGNFLYPKESKYGHMVLLT